MEQRLGILSLLIGIAFAQPAAAALEDVESVRQCVKENEPETSSIQTVTFTSTSRSGAETVSHAKIWWRRFDDGSKSFMQFSDPPEIEGSALLIVEQDERNSDMWMYLPELDNVRRVTKHTLRGSLFGTDLTYEDFERMQAFTEDADAELKPSAEIEGRPVYVVAGKPAHGKDSDYERSVSFIDQETCVTLRTELYGRGDRLVKTMVTPRDKIEKQEKGHVPRFVRIDDVLDETHTIFTVDEIELNTDIRRSLFSQRALSQMH